MNRKELKELQDSLARRYQSGDRRALEELIESCQGMIVELASKFRVSGIPFEDLRAEGITAVIIAAEKYRPGPCANFSASAWLRIKDRLREAERVMSRQVSSPRSRIERLLRQEVSRDIAAAENAGMPHSAAVAFAADMHNLTVRQVDEFLNNRFSVAIDSFDEDEPADQTPTAFDHVAGANAVLITTEIMSELSDIERAVIQLSIVEEVGFAETAQRLSIPRDLERRIRTAAMQKLRAAVKRRGLRSDDVL